MQTSICDQCKFVTAPANLEDGVCHSCHAGTTTPVHQYSAENQGVFKHEYAVKNRFGGTFLFGACSVLFGAFAILSLSQDNLAATVFPVLMMAFCVHRSYSFMVKDQVFVFTSSQIELPKMLGRDKQIEISDIASAHIRPSDINAGTKQLVLFFDEDTEPYLINEIDFGKPVDFDNFCHSLAKLYEP